MTAERCSQLSEVATEASRMRLDGIDKATAQEKIRELMKSQQAGTPTEQLDAAVMLSYMAKMKPESMKEYYNDQCMQDVIQ